MPKALQITDEIKRRILAVAGDVDVSTVTVFETTAINTKPLRKRGTLFDRGRHTRSTLVEMAEVLNSGQMNVPMHTLHMQGYELPVGKVIYGQVFDTSDGESELRVQFYISNTNANLIADIENGTIDEVSIGIQHKQILCSECGFDFLGPDATFDNLWSRTCNKDHTLGENGVHARLSGVENWMELSLVSRGAANKAKIVSRSDAKLSEERKTRLAAAGLTAEATTLVANLKIEDETMDLKALSDKVAELSADAALAKAKVTELEASVTAKNEQIAALTAQIEAAKQPTEIAEKLAAAEKQLADVSTFLKEHAKAALTASGQKTDAVPDDITEVISVIEESTLKLHNLIPVGGVAKTDLAATANDSGLGAGFGAFKTMK